MPFAQYSRAIDPTWASTGSGKNTARTEGGRPQAHTVLLVREAAQEVVDPVRRVGEQQRRAERLVGTEGRALTVAHHDLRHERGRLEAVQREAARLERAERRATDERLRRQALRVVHEVAERAENDGRRRRRQIRVHARVAGAVLERVRAHRVGETVADGHVDGARGVRRRDDDERAREVVGHHDRRHAVDLDLGIRPEARPREPQERPAGQRARGRSRRAQRGRRAAVEHLDRVAQARDEPGVGIENDEVVEAERETGGDVEAELDRRKTRHLQDLCLDEDLR
jgi:hypothetical protein